MSVNVGLPSKNEWNGRIVRTSIFKEPVTGRVRVAKLNVDGDRQSDLTVHGGPDKSVYAYPSEHYPFWREERPDMDLPWEETETESGCANLLLKTRRKQPARIRLIGWGGAKIQLKIFCEKRAFTLMLRSKN